MWWKRFKRRRRFTRKRNLTYLLFLFILLSIGLGYAVLNTTLGIDGISQLANAKWDIHFDNIVVKEGSVTPTSAATITDDTTVSFSVTLENPGDYYDFNIDVVNAGTINAMIDTISIQPVLTENQQKYLDYIVTYEDGVSLAENQRLDAGDSETLRIAFIYKEGDPEDYPDEDEDIPVEVSIIYVQENGEAIDVDYAPTLYNVLKRASKEGYYAREYTGAHKDSFTQNPSKKIYHWYADNDTDGTAILDKNNVIFAGQCWQMIRTTDTGGVKLLYYGEAENNQCLNTRGTHVGYSARVSQNLASNYWYGTDYIYDSTNQLFSISGTTEQVKWSATEGPGLIGKYTCKLTSVDGTCSTLYLVESYNNASNANVIPLDSSSDYSQFGKLRFNPKNDLPTYFGYMYEDYYASGRTNESVNQKFETTQTVLSSTSLATSYWYADSITWGSPVANRYNLNNPYQVSSIADYSNLVGKYTFRSTNGAHTASNVYYIAAVNDSTMYYKQLQNGNLLSAYDPIMIGDSLTDNGDGTYTITNSTPVTLSDWYTDYATYVNKYTCNDSSTICAYPRYITETTSTKYTYISVAEKIMIGKGHDSEFSLTDTLLVSKGEWGTNFNDYSDYNYTCNTDSSTCTEENIRMIASYRNNGYYYAPNFYYGSSVIWDGTNYSLVDPVIEEPSDSISGLSDKLSTHHYICVSPGLKTCPTVAYVFHYNGAYMWYVTLKEGVPTVLEALEDMLTKNTTNSVIKSGIDAWYKHYLLEDYDEYIEDTIFCNDRSIQTLNSWNPDGGRVRTYLELKGHTLSTDLSCANTTDQFSVSNNNAKLTYKVGLLSGPEEKILNNRNIGKTGQPYWLLSPIYFFGNGAVSRYLDASGELAGHDVNASLGVKPAISLKPGTTYSTGDGSMANPYIVNTH